MSLVFAAITPHTPVLVPSIGREHLSRLKKTVEALKALEADLTAARPDAIVIISPHGQVADTHFAIDFNESYACNLREFGVFDFSLPCRADMRLTSAIRERAEDAEQPIMLRSEEALDYGVIVPLMYLTLKLGAFNVVPVMPSRLDAKAHHDFGKVLQDVILHSDRRIAVIASAELSHRLSEEAPGGYSPRAKLFDERVRELLASKTASGLLTMDPELVQEAGTCGLMTLALFSGILDKLDAEPEILSYEAPFGIGLLTARYKLS